MKTIKLWAAIALLCVVCFYGGREWESYYYNVDNLFLRYLQLKDSCQQYYEDAAHMSDLIRCYKDHLNEDSLIEDWGCFEELEGIFLHDDALGNPVDLSKYSWCY